MKIINYLILGMLLALLQVFSEVFVTNKMPPPLFRYHRHRVSPEFKNSDVPSRNNKKIKK